MANAIWWPLLQQFYNRYFVAFNANFSYFFLCRFVRVWKPCVCTRAEVRMRAPYIHIVFIVVIWMGIWAMRWTTSAKLRLSSHYLLPAFRTLSATIFRITYVLVSIHTLWSGTADGLSTFWVRHGELNVLKYLNQYQTVRCSPLTLGKEKYQEEKYRVSLNALFVPYVCFLMPCFSIEIKIMSHFCVFCQTFYSDHFCDSIS